MAANRGAQGVTASIGAPVGGLNARDSYAEMPETDAIIMDNWFPSPSGVTLRNGCSSAATGFPDWVETVMGYNGGATKKLFGISNGNIYDATAGGAIGAAVVSGLTNSRWQHVNFGTPGGKFLICCNGADTPRYFDGSTWTAMSWTGPASLTTMISVTAHVSRLWFVEKDLLKVWYLPVNAIAGAATALDLSSIFLRGGYLMSMVSWVVDTVGSLNHYAAFITSEGEVAVYAGTDPSSASTWALVALFRVGRPVGRRCTCKVGEDILIISADGLFPLSKALQTDRSENDAAISFKIMNLINNDVQAYSANFGWQCILHPIGNKIILNVPTMENSVQYQYVMNTVNNSWCRFTGWNAACWELQGDNLYYGTNQAIMLADTGASDAGNAIVADVLPAYSYFRRPGQQKQFTMARPVMQSNGALNILMDLNIDFEQRTPASAPTLSTVTGSPWNTSPWNTSGWGGATQMLKNWQGVGGIGFAAALRMKVASIGVSLRWNATDYVFIPGGLL